MKFLFILIVLTSTIGSSFAQEYYYDEPPRKEIEYKTCTTNEDYLIISKSKRWYGTNVGIADRDRKEIFPAVFEKVYVFSNGAFLLFDGYKTTLVSSDFKIQKSYDGYIGENNSYFVTIGRNNTQFPIEVFDLNGNSLIQKLNLDMSAGYYVSPLNKNEELNRGLFVVTKEDKFGKQAAALFDVVNFKWLTEFGNYQFISYGAGALAVKDRIKNPRRYEYDREEEFGLETGLPDSKFNADYFQDGKKIRSFENAYLVNGSILVCSSGSDKFGAFDKNMRVIVPFEFDLPSNFESTVYWKYVVLAKGGESFAFDSKGNMIFDSGFQKLTPLGRNVFQVQKNGKIGIITTEQKEIIPIKYDSIAIANRYILGRIGSTWEILSVKDLNGSKVVQSGITSVKTLSMGALVIQKNNKWALFTSEENAPSFEFDDIDFTGYHLIYKLGDKYGFLSEEGKVQTKPLYESITNEVDELYVVGIKGKYGLVELDTRKAKAQINDKIAAKYDFIARDRSGSYNYRGYNFIVLDRNTGKSEIKEVEVEDRY